MATLWDVITGNSNLPVQAGNTFWDHMQNQKTGGTPVFINGFDVIVEDEVITTIIEDNNLLVNIEDSDVLATIDNNTVNVTIEDGDIATVIDSDVNVTIGCD